MRRFGALPKETLRGFRHPSALNLAARSISSANLEVVRETLPAVAAVGPDFTGHFYQRMFAAHPELLNTFNVSNQREGRQQKALFSAIACTATSVLEHGTFPNQLLAGVHHKHCALNVLPEQYEVVGTHLLGTIVDLLDPPSHVLEAWGELYQALATECIDRSEELYLANEQKEGGWRGEREFVLKRKQAKSDTVTEFTFAPADGQPICSYIPGQYTTVWVEGEGWTNRQPRHYTLVGVPNGEDYTIGVKKEPQGLVSGFLHDQLSVGDRLPLSPPFGDFHVKHADKIWVLDSQHPVVFLSAGMGITPTLSMLGHVKNEQRTVLWLHAAENGRLHPYRDYLVGLAQAKSEGFTRRVWYNHPEPEDEIGEDNTSVYHFKGTMDVKQVETELPLHDEHAMYFMCGPPAFMDSMSKQLSSLGVPRQNLAFESFDPWEEGGDLVKQYD